MWRRPCISSQTRIRLCQNLTSPHFYFSSLPSLSVSPLLSNEDPVLQRLETMRQLRSIMSSMEGVTVVHTKAQAEHVVTILKSLPPYRNPMTSDDITTTKKKKVQSDVYKASINRRYHAWDTETVGIDLKKESAVGKGRIICLSCYCGPDVDFGNGPRLWIDVLGEYGLPLLEQELHKGLSQRRWGGLVLDKDQTSNTIGDPLQILSTFSSYFNDVNILKVWHNYGFDRHMIANHGLAVQGFGGDTMHMARLWDPSRSYSGGYSLAGLTSDLLSGDSSGSSKYSFQRRKAKDEEGEETADASVPEPNVAESLVKRNMKESFGKKRIKKDGSEGKEILIASPLQLQTSIMTLKDWIHYSALDSESLWFLREELESRLRRMPWHGTAELSMFDFYYSLLRPFGEMLTNMESRGVKVNNLHLKAAQSIAENDKKLYEQTFFNWANLTSQNHHSSQSSSVVTSLLRMNIQSSSQIQQLLFAPCRNKTTREVMASERDFDILNTEGYIEEGKKKPKKHRTLRISGLGMPVVEVTASGWPAISSSVLKKLLGDQSLNYKNGIAYQFYHGGTSGLQACEALDALSRASSIQTLLSSFIVPLQTMSDSQQRIHASLNLNTETGRLSCRKPNLQNQPALEKDIYLIRRAFTCEEGNALVVADYGQLELRVLAHMSQCSSMIEAFKSGGDFHSRTAMGMYPYIADAVRNGSVALESGVTLSNHKPIPLLKDVYGSERRRAKTLNFSIAYGKTARGLALDWNTSTQEAEQTLELWYQDRPEVRQWQRDTIAFAHKSGYTRTLMGRHRYLPEIKKKMRGLRAHAERAAINTPIQGGAADIVMMAMLRLEDDRDLRQMGFKVVLQIHDEIILEGPKDCALDALRRVKEVMSNPLTIAADAGWRQGPKLLVDLVVDAKVAQTWYDAK